MYKNHNHSAIIITKNFKITQFGWSVLISVTIFFCSSWYSSCESAPFSKRFTHLPSWLINSLLICRRFPGEIAVGTKGRPGCFLSCLSFVASKEWVVCGLSKDSCFFICMRLAQVCSCSAEYSDLWLSCSFFSISWTSVHSSSWQQRCGKILKLLVRMFFPFFETEQL